MLDQCGIDFQVGAVRQYQFRVGDTRHWQWEEKQDHLGHHESVVSYESKCSWQVEFCSRHEGLGSTMAVLQI